MMKINAIRYTAILILCLLVTGAGSCPNTPTVNLSVMTAAEQQLANDALAAINSRRSGLGLGPLTAYPAGAQVAFDHCVAMQVGNFFNHVNPTTGTDPATRAKIAGITHNPSGLVDPNSNNPFVGENLFMTTDPNVSGQAAVDAWVGSAGHRTQIDAPLPVPGAQTMPAWTHCGIGVRKNGDTSWWTAMFFRNPN